MTTKGPYLRNLGLEGKRRGTHAHAMGWHKESDRHEPSARTPWAGTRKATGTSRARARAFGPSSSRRFFLQILQNALLGSFDVRFRFFHVDGRPVAVAVEYAPVHHGEHDVGTMACVHGV